MAALLRHVSPGRLLLGVCLGVVLFVLLLQAVFVLRVLWYSHFNPGPTPVMRAAMSELWRQQPEAELRYQWVDYDAISPALKQAVIASEDSRFLQHRGADWDAIRAAWEHNRDLAARRAAAEQAGREPPRGTLRGASTITQQTAKNLFLSNDRSYWRKAQELVLAWMMETFMSKRRILELYLNIAEWGNGVFGAEAAARHHFGRGAGQLSARQAAQLAARLPNPRFYDTRGVTSYLNSRTNTIAARLRHAEIP